MSIVHATSRCHNRWQWIQCWNNEQCATMSCTQTNAFIGTLIEFTFSHLFSVVYAQDPWLIVSPVFIIQSSLCKSIDFITCFFSFRSSLDFKLTAISRFWSVNYSHIRFKDKPNETVKIAPLSIINSTSNVNWLAWWWVSGTYIYSYTYTHVILKKKKNETIIHLKSICCVVETFLIW